MANPNVIFSECRDRAGMRPCDLPVELLRRAFVFLAYADDSGTKNKHQLFQLVTAVVIPDRAFRDTELIAAASLKGFIPESVFPQFFGKFKEFKGAELFGGYGAFEGIDEEIRFNIMGALLAMVRNYGFPVIFGALNKAEWDARKSKDGDLFKYGAVEPIDICFRTCLKGINNYVENNRPAEFAMLIADNQSDGDTREMLKKAFYNYRQRLNPNELSAIPYLHDDMYFGDSSFSVGIQLADLCGFVISKWLDKDPSIERFYKIIEAQIMYSRIEPEGKIVHPER